MFNQILSRSSKDQLFVLELLVHELKVFSDRISEITSPLSISLKFADLPPLRINQEDFVAVKDNERKSSTEEKVIWFDVGKTCLFPCQSSELKSWIQKKPLEIKVHKFSCSTSTQNEEKGEVEKDLLCSTKIFLSDLFSDFGTIIQNRDLNNPFDSKILTNTYYLQRWDGSVFGSIKIFLRLSFLGKSVITKFALQDPFLFKTERSLNEFQCVKVIPQDKEDDTHFNSDFSSTKFESKTANSDDIKRLGLIYKDLATTDGDSLVNVPENSNADNIFQTVITCNDENTTIPLPKTYFSDHTCLCMNEIVNMKSSLRNTSYSENSSFNSDVLDQQQFFVKLRRMRGGACDSKDDTSDTDNLLNYDTRGNACYCYQMTSSNLKSRVKDIKADCFQKSINEAQEILNSLGKKDGFAGLGILGPSESPYFGRTKDNESVYLLSSQREVEALSSHTRDMAYKSNIREKDNKKEHKFDKYENSGIPKLGVNTKTETKFHKGPKLKRDLMQENPSNTGISTVFQRNENYAVYRAKQAPRRKNGKRIKRRRKDFKRNNKTYNVKPFSSTTNSSMSLKPSMKVSRHILKHAYAMRKYNPGIYYGHRNCIDLNMRIPANMGWLWNTSDNPGISKPRYGWRPGAISKYVYELLMKAKSESGVKISTEKTSLQSTTETSKLPKTRSLQSLVQSKDRLRSKTKAEQEDMPMIQIQRKDGDYYVTINPAKKGDSKTKPLQLKISKNEDGDDNISKSTAPDFELGCSPPIHSVVESKVKTKDVDTQVKSQEILDAFKSTDVKPAVSKAKKTGSIPKKGSNVKAGKK